MPTFGNRLRNLREEKGIKQTELAEMLSLSSSATISQYESNKRVPDAHILEKLASIFEVSVDYLLGRTAIRSTTGMEKNNGEILGDPQIYALARASRKLSSDKKDLLKRIAESMIEEAIKDEENRD